MVSHPPRRAIPSRRAEWSPIQYPKTLLLMREPGDAGARASLPVPSSQGGPRVGPPTRLGPSAPVAQLDRASVYGTEGQRFESSRARSQKPFSRTTSATSTLILDEIGDRGDRRWAVIWCPSQGIEVRGICAARTPKRLSALVGQTFESLAGALDRPQGLNGPAGCGKTGHVIRCIGGPTACIMGSGGT